MSKPSPYWSAPPLWPGATVCIIGGGPSLTQAQVDACRGRCKVIVINDSLQLCPWADVHYFCDKKWWIWHKEKAWYKDFRGLRVTLENLDLPAHEPDIKCLHNRETSVRPPHHQMVLSDVDHGLITGRNSGYQCVNLAVHFGVARILLLGIDMKKGAAAAPDKLHWFGDHPHPTDPTVFAQMRGHFDKLAPELTRRGIAVANCAPGSALECFKRGSIESVLADPPAAPLPA